jgi:hypothetical protein
MRAARKSRKRAPSDLNLQIATSKDACRPEEP